MSLRARQLSGWSSAFVLIVVLSLVPVAWIVMLSLKTPATATDGSFIPHQWTLSNYSDIFKQGIFTNALRNSIGIGLISTALAVALASAAAYAIARLEFPGKQVILAVALAVVMFPQISLVGPLYNLWRQIGLYDTWPGLIIPYMTFALPLSIYVLSSFFREIPWELEQAAQVDGATPFQAFRKVIAPLAMPGIVTTFIIVFLICWNDFVFAISLTSTTNAETVPAAIAQFPGASQFTQPIGDIAAAAVVVTVPVMILVLFFQRRIVAGLTAGAVKG
ncbi:MAG: trehalose/maltose transport system permease protein [Solirubrobacteraceae bacterium]|jgi:multiple sugar transport system permease protein|nr:trehalose/maltose transport system permease protein [Solirubrobacteraceae bacterium]